MNKLNKIEIEKKSIGLIDWKINATSIEKEIIFKNFKDCMFFINQVAEIANKLNHHPEWFNVYNKLEIKLTTHDVNGLSELDFTFAKKIDLLLSNKQQ